MKRRVLSVLVAAVLLMTAMLAAQPIVASASSQLPVAVEGRMLESSEAGDTSAWIEIARYGDYSLIIRQTPLTSNTTWYFNMIGNSAYSNSLPRKEFNTWYSSKLPVNAKLRSFAVTNNAMSNLGTFGTTAVDGISRPLGVTAPFGNDVAFALSFYEAASYCSTQYAAQQIAGSPVTRASSKEATNNYNRLLPTFTGASQTPAYWLRTPGQLNQYACCVVYAGGTPVDLTKGCVYQQQIMGNYGHYRPAMWVGSGIFQETGTIIVKHVNIADNTPLSADEIYSVPAGPYGPYDPKTFGDYNYAGLAPGSAQPSGFISENETLTIIYQYTQTPVGVRITYNPNGGTGAVNDYFGAPGSAHTVFDQGYANDDFVFDSWNTNIGGNGVRYENGDLITLVNDITLYAQWTEVIVDNSQLVLYNPNGGTGAPEYDLTDATGRITIVKKNFALNDHEFVNWNTRADGLGVTYEVGQEVVLNSYLILYAQWVNVATYSVTYHPGVGYGGSVDPTKFAAGDTYVVKSPALVNVDRPDLMHYFTYWTLTPNGTGPQYQPGDQLVITGDVTLYANWIAV